MPTAIGKRSAEANRAFQLYSLVDICYLGATWAHCKRRAKSMVFWGWAPLPNVLGLLASQSCFTQRTVRRGDTCPYEGNYHDEPELHCHVVNNFSWNTSKHPTSSSRRLSVEFGPIHPAVSVFCRSSYSKIFLALG